MPNGSWIDELTSADRTAQRFHAFEPTRAVAPDGAVELRKAASLRLAVVRAGAFSERGAGPGRRELRRSLGTASLWVVMVSLGFGAQEERSIVE
jgi:hypothetical protein